jgi:hypothetical protein
MDRQRSTLPLIVIAAVLMLSSLAASAGEFLTTDKAVPGRYLVVFKEDAPGPPVADHGRALAFTHGGRLGRVFEHAFRGFELLGDERAARAIARDPRVAFVEQDMLLEPFATQALPHWGLDRIDERDRPRNNHFTYHTTGAGVNIYILDTGINADADLGARRMDAYSAITDANGVPQYGDCNGHGTAVAKLAGGTVGGVAKGATLRNVRVGSVCGGGGCAGCVPRQPTVMPASVGGSSLGYLLADVVAGMNWVAANRVRPAVANVSLGGPASATLDTALRGMHNAGVTVVVAAGNSGVDACGVSPARVAEAITVGASDINDARAIFDSSQSSNTGLCLDLFAPGKDVNGFSGTSAAAPIVAGAAALYLQTSTLASPATVASHLVNNATAGRLTGIGSSPNRLLFVTPGGTETDQPPVALGFTCNCNGGRTCTFNNTGYTDDFAVTRCQYLVDYDQWDRPIFRFHCGPVSYTYSYPGPYLVEFQVVDDANQASSFVSRWCQ